MLVDYILAIGLSFLIYLAFALPVLTYKNGFSYWKARDIYHILIFSVFGVAFLMVRGLGEIVVFAGGTIILLILHRWITGVNAIPTLYDFMRRDGVSRSERSIYTVSTNILLIVLALLHWDKPVYFTLGMLVMAFADKMGEIIGRIEGEHEYEIITKKSLEGSISVFLTAALIILGGTSWVHEVTWVDVPYYLLLAGLVAIIEAISVKFLDNVLIPYTVSFGLLFLSTL